MEENEKVVEPVPYIVHEAALARAERHIKRLWILALVLILLLAGSNAGWIYYESQFEDIVTSVTQEVSADGEGTATIYGEHAGAVINGESTSDDKN